MNTSLSASASVATPAAVPTARSTYRHGDLRRALLQAGIELARSGGPEAVVLREVTRRAGVVPNAAYRHFGSLQELLKAVRAAALSASAAAMEAELATVPAGLAPADEARARLRAIGTGYLRFAQAETGLFRTAYMASDDMAGAVDPERAGPGGLNPFQLLGAALDQMVAAGVMPAVRRPGAELLAWSTVHGLAMLVLDGPLGAVIGARMPQVGQQLLDVLERGFSL